MEGTPSNFGDDKLIYKKYVYSTYGNILPMMMAQHVKEIFYEIYPKEVQLKKSLKELNITSKKFDQDFDDLNDVVRSFKKEDIDAMAAKIIPEIIQEGEKNFWAKHEHEFLKIFLTKGEIEAYYKVKNDAKESEKQHLENENLWKNEIDELKKDFLFLMREDINNYHKKYVHISGKAELWTLMQKKIEENFLKSVYEILSQFSLVLFNHSEVLCEHFSFYTRNARLEFETISPKISLTKMEKIKKSKNFNKNYIMHWFTKDYCSCDSEEISEEKNQELETILKKTHEKFQKVTEPYALLEGTNVEKSKKDFNLEENLYNLIKNFQKYSHFVKTALPKYIDFLEILEDLMIFELSKVVQNYHPEYFEGNHLKLGGMCDPCYCDRPRADDPLFLKFVINETKIISPTKFEACYAKKENIFGPLFHKNLNIRRDFRNMVAKGLEQNDLNEGWNYYFKKENLDEKIVSPKSSEEFIKLYRREDSTDINLTNSHLSIDSLSLGKLGIIKSKLLTAVDSFTVFKTKEKHHSNFTLERPPSKSVALRSALNSLTLIRRSYQTASVQFSEKNSSIKTSKCQIPPSRSRSMSSNFVFGSGTVKSDIETSILDPKDSLVIFCQFLKGIIPRSKSVQNSIQRNSNIWGSNSNKKVRISCVEPLNLDPEVHFAEKPSLIPTISTSESFLTSSDFTVTGNPKHNICDKNYLHIAGDPNLNEHLQNKNEFLIRRIDSLIRFLEKNPCLRDFFQIDRNKSQINF